MTVVEKIAALRTLMAQHGWDAVIISGTDPHGSEYLPQCWQQRQWISGFTGSFGTVVITLDHAGLWTDTRYFIQANEQLAGSGIELHKLRVPHAVDYPEWLGTHLPPGATVAIDGWCTGVDLAHRLEAQLAPIGGRLCNAPNFLDAIWAHRPALPMAPLFLMDTAYAGRSAIEKLEWLRAQLSEAHCTHIILNALDQIAWLFNIRCHDVAYNPVAISYALVDATTATLFIEVEKVGRTVRQMLQASGISVAPYTQLTEAVGRIEAPASAQESPRIWVDPAVMNYQVYHTLCQHFPAAQRHEAVSPILLEKSLKNPVEIEGYRQAYVKDGVALTRFFKWLESAVGTQRITEATAAKYLTQLRAEAPQAMGDGFRTISAYGPHAALPHYETTEEGACELQPKGLYLVDSGGHYIHGTTDITRTVPLGPLTDLEREDYTLVLKGMIQFSTAVFPYGTVGAHIDALARIPLWKYERNYGHGTGHGIGHYLCVHEGPQDIRQNLYNQALLPGMVTSIEPGLYREGQHGVRHENVVHCTEAGENEFGRWLTFETLTLCYIDTRPLVKELLTQEEIQWLNAYHARVQEALAPYLNEEENDWLRIKTAAI